MFGWFCDCWLRCLSVVLVGVDSLVVVVCLFVHCVLLFAVLCSGLADCRFIGLLIVFTCCGLVCSIDLVDWLLISWFVWDLCLSFVVRCVLCLLLL